MHVAKIKSASQPSLFLLHLSKQTSTLRQGIQWRYFANLRERCGYVSYVGGWDDGYVNFMGQKCVR